MKNKIRVSAVSYLNAQPFVHGLKQSKELGRMILELDQPAECARKLINKEADIGLVPVVMIEQIPEAQIISDYCIGADGEVASVLLLSNSPMNEIHTIVMDNESRTSVKLAKLLARHYWKIEPNWIDEKEIDLAMLNGNTAAVVIGDRALSIRDSYRYKYDLALEWKKFTGLPFVFACWVSNTAIDYDFLATFNRALKYGLDNRDELLGLLGDVNFDLRKYLTQNIQYNLDDEKRKGMKNFLSLSKQM